MSSDEAQYCATCIVDKLIIECLAITGFKGQMERFEYKGCVVDIFTAIKNGQWTWAFTVDAGLAEANKAAGFENATSAINAAKEKARRLIDQQP